MRESAPTYRRRGMSKRRHRRVAPVTDEQPNLNFQIGASIIASVIALLFIPVLFGAIGAILGGYVFFRGDKPMGFGLIVAAVAATVFGMLIGMIVWSSQYGYR